jgi:AraC-like DNA-binding protein/ActR/RegA family two-component response regulator
MAFDDENGVHFALVSDAHRFLLAAAWLRQPESASALARFLAAAAMHTLPAASIDAIVLRVVRVLDRHRDGRVPTLLQRYLDLAVEIPDPLTAFRRCIEDVLRSSGVHEPNVQRAIALLADSYTDSGLSLTTIAARLDLRPARLCRIFKTNTGLTVMEYLREVRLDHAAVRLITISGTVKDVWTAVGYNHASNFDHDFRRRFGITPHEFRARGIQPLIPATLANAPKQTPQARHRPSAVGKRVLVVEDDDCMRDTYARYLRLEGYTVVTAVNGEDGLRQAECMGPDVVLFDYRLPDRDGLDCLRTLRRRALRKQPAVVLFSADWTLQDHAAEVRSLGARIQSKLCDIDEIECLLRALCTNADSP